MSAVLVCMAPLGARADRGLVEAVKRQDAPAVRALLRGPVDVNERQPDGATALHWAAHWNDLETARLLMLLGADVNATNDLGIAPLHLASENGSGSMVRALLEAGARPDAAGPSGVTPLMTSSRVGSVESAIALLARGADVNARETAHGQTPLMWAAAHEHADVVRALIEHGADVNARSQARVVLTNTGHPIGLLYPNTENSSKLVKLANTPQGGSTPLLFAARQGGRACAELLLAAGAHVDDPAPDGRTPLVLAAFSGHGALAAFLLEKGADPNAAGAGHSALHAAVLRGDLHLVKALLARRADPNLPLTKGTAAHRWGQDFMFPAFLAGATPFFLASKYLEIDIMRALLDAGADPRVMLLDGTTALIAATGYDWGVSGANRRLRVLPLGNAENTPEGRVAEQTRTLEAVRMLVGVGVDVNAANQNGEKALRSSVPPEVRDFLLQHGAMGRLKDDRGR